MNEKNADWNDLKFFLDVARNKGLSGAARDTGKSAATLGRRMQSLEQSMGIEIFHRHARGYDLTEHGEALFAKVAALDAEVRPLFESKTGAKKTLVKVSAGHWTSLALAKYTGEIVKAAPDAMLRFISSNEFLNINHREAVIGIRNQRPQQTGLACRKIGTVSYAGYATDAAISGWIRVVSNAPSARWLTEQTDFETAMEANSSQLAKELALQGLGRVVLPRFIGDQIPRLKQVHPSIADLTHEQWIVSHNEDRFIPMVRKVLDEVVKALTLLRD